MKKLFQTAGGCAAFDGANGMALKALFGRVDSRWEEGLLLLKVAGMQD